MGIRCGLRGERRRERGEREMDHPRLLHLHGRTLQRVWCGVDGCIGVRRD